MWKQCGTPCNSVITDVMRRIQAKYYGIVNNLKRDQTAIKRTTLAQSLFNSDTSSFWNELRDANNKCNAAPDIAIKVL